MVKRKIEGTVKFEIYMYRARAVRRTTKPRPRDYVYRQWGRILLKNEKGKTIANKPFTDYGDMLKFINEKMRKVVMNDLKAKGKWK